MENLICIDSSVLIDHYRKKIKERAFLFHLSLQYQGFTVQPFVHFEIYCGVTPEKKNYWDNIFSDLIILPYSVQINETAISIYRSLKSKGKNIDFRDLMIAATAILYKQPLATINKKHFEDIAGLKVVTPSNL